MNTTISTKSLGARKPHSCDWCGLTIATGETYNRSAVAGDGSVWTWKSHPECDDEISTMYHDGDGFSQHALIEDVDSQSEAWQRWYGDKLEDEATAAWCIYFDARVEYEESRYSKRREALELPLRTAFLKYRDAQDASDAHQKSKNEEKP